MKEVTGKQRQNFLHDKAGRAFMQFENCVFGTANNWDPENYAGGFWKFYEVKGHDEEMEADVDAWFMALDEDEEMTAACYYGEVKTDALTWSVALNLVIFSNLSFHYDDKGEKELTQLFSNAYHSLKNAAFGKLIPNINLEHLCKIID